MRLRKANWAIAVALAVICLDACGTAGLRPGPQSGIVGKWRSTDGSYVVEFLPTGDCAARMRIQGREVGGPCKYTADKDTITLHYYGPDNRPPEEPKATATWQYTLAGDTLNVTVFGNSLDLRRVP